jgi:hypothetical protein
MLSKWVDGVAVRSLFLTKPSALERIFQQPSAARLRGGGKRVDGKISSHMQAISSNYVLLNVLKAVEKDAEV